MKVFLRFSLEKAILTAIISILSVIFQASGLIPMAIYTNWLILIIGPIFKGLKIYDLPDVEEIALFFGSIFFAGYITSCFIVEKKERLNRFLRPNMLKIALFVIVILLANTPGIGTFDTHEKEPSIAIGIPGYDSTVVYMGNRTFYSFSPVLWFPFWYSDSFIGSGHVGPGFYYMFEDTIPAPYLLYGPSSHLHQLRDSMPGMVLYWYLLSCSLYSVFSRLKNKQIFSFFKKPVLVGR